MTYNDKAFGVKSFRDGLIELVTMDEFRCSEQEPMPLNFAAG